MGEDKWIELDCLIAKRIKWSDSNRWTPPIRFLRFSLGFNYGSYHHPGYEADATYSQYLFEMVQRGELDFVRDGRVIKIILNGEVIGYVPIR